MFNLSKSHKKILKRINNFLRTGKRSDNTSPMDADQEYKNDDYNNAHNANARDNDSSVSSSSNEQKAMIDLNQVLDLAKSAITFKPDMPPMSPSNELNNTVSVSNKTTGVDSINIPDPKKPLQQKAKIMRQQRILKKKNSSKNSSSKSMFTDPSEKTMPWRKVQKNSEQTLKSLVDAMPSDGKHKLQVSSQWIL